MRKQRLYPPSPTYPVSLWDMNPLTFIKPSYALCQQTLVWADQSFCLRIWSSRLASDLWLTSTLSFSAAVIMLYHGKSYGKSCFRRESGGSIWSHGLLLINVCTVLCQQHLKPQLIQSVHVLTFTDQSTSINKSDTWFFRWMLYGWNFLIFSNWSNIDRESLPDEG